MNVFLDALRTFTRIPLPNNSQSHVSLEETSWGIPALPAVGWLIGFVLWVVSLLNGIITAELTALLVLMVWILMTGGVHFNGVNQITHLGTRAKGLDLDSEMDRDSWNEEGDYERVTDILEPTSAPAFTDSHKRLQTGFQLEQPINIQGALLLAVVLLAKWAMLVALLKADLSIWLLALPFIARVGALMWWQHTSKAEGEIEDDAFVEENTLGQSAWGWFALALVIIVFGAPILFLLAAFVWLLHLWVKERSNQPEAALVFGIPVELFELGGLMCLVLAL